MLGPLGAALTVFAAGILVFLVVRWVGEALAPFRGQVVIANTTGKAQDWTLELAFPDNVGKLLVFWIDGSEKPRLHRVDNRHFFTSVTPVDPKSQVVLKVKFTRAGDDVDPEICELNGSQCRV
jgi:hypothetical protein